MHEALHRQLIAAGLDAKGDTERKLRERVAQFARDVTLERTVMARLDPAIEHLVDAIARGAAAIDDADVEQARKSGLSEAALFEITAAAAVACGMQRLEEALEVLRRSQS